MDEALPRPRFGPFGRFEGRTFSRPLITTIGAAEPIVLPRQDERSSNLGGMPGHTIVHDERSS